MTTPAAAVKEHQDEARQAFDNAIIEGRLSKDERASNYAGNYMYMGNDNGVDYFKDALTREYIK